MGAEKLGAGRYERRCCFLNPPRLKNSIYKGNIPRILKISLLGMRDIMSPRIVVMVSGTRNLTMIS